MGINQFNNLRLRFGAVCSNTKRRERVDDRLVRIYTIVFRLVMSASRLIGYVWQCMLSTAVKPGCYLVDDVDIFVVVTFNIVPVVCEYLLPVHEQV